MAEAVLPGNALAYVTLQLPGLHEGRIQCGLRLGRSGLLRLAGPHPPDSAAECVAVGFHREHLTEEFLLELVTLSHVRALPELQDQLRQRLLGSLLPRVLEHLLWRHSLIRQPYPSSVHARRQRRRPNSLAPELVGKRTCRRICADGAGVLAMPFEDRQE